jgi:hypothetical protein
MFLGSASIFGKIKDQIVDMSRDVCIKGIPKKQVFISSFTIANIAALYIFQPDELSSQVLTIGIATIGAWLVTEGSYKTASKVKTKVLDGHFQNKQDPNEFEELEKDIMLRGLSMDLMLRGVTLQVETMMSHLNQKETNPNKKFQRDNIQTGNDLFNLGKNLFDDLNKAL